MNKNKIIFLILGIILGSVSIILFYKVKEMLDSWSSLPPYINSSEKVYTKLAKIGIELPSKAYNIELYLDDGFLDYTCYLAFSATPKEIKDFIGNAQKKHTNKTMTQATPHISKNKNGQMTISWWPENTEKFEIYYRQFCWMGYDKKNSRLYIYQYSM